MTPARRGVVRTLVREIIIDVSESTRIPEWPGWCRLPFVESWAFWIPPVLPDPERAKGMAEAVERALARAFDDEPDEDAGEIGLDEAFAKARRYADMYRAWKGGFQDCDYTAAFGEWLVANFFQIADRCPIREYTRGRKIYRPLREVRRHVAKPWILESLQPGDESIIKRHTDLNQSIVKQCIEKAERSPFHYAALGDVVNVLNDAQQPLSGALLNWSIKSRAPDKRGRPRRREYHVRNGSICAAVEDLVAHGMRATRNDVSPHHSACDVAAKAFDLSYGRVLEIWRERRSRA